MAAAFHAIQSGCADELTLPVAAEAAKLSHGFSIGLS